ncbi:hypothetical protein EVG20_g11173 [Dentipellis fragilis]|uniref:Uncharacterized protein n=1 Tax=Dentipellis fragilis TaxID=205917 RepID=A0A4Y9XNY1_9AGAM|nr:hypothetical protein EVG20_g11173 [Dentipellis fragilis]
MEPSHPYETGCRVLQISRFWPSYSSSELLPSYFSCVLFDSFNLPLYTAAPTSTAPSASSISIDPGGSIPILKCSPKALDLFGVCAPLNWPILLQCCSFWQSAEDIRQRVARVGRTYVLCYDRVTRSSHEHEYVFTMRACLSFNVVLDARLLRVASRLSAFVLEDYPMRNPLGYFCHIFCLPPSPAKQSQMEMENDDPQIHSLENDIVRNQKVLPLNPPGFPTRLGILFKLAHSLINKVFGPGEYSTQDFEDLIEYLSELLVLLPPDDPKSNPFLTMFRETLEKRFSPPPRDTVFNDDTEAWNVDGDLQLGCLRHLGLYSSPRETAGA